MIKNHLVIAVVLLSGSALGHPGEHEEGVTHDPHTGEHVRREDTAASASSSDNPFMAGRLVFRGSANFDLNRTIKLGGQKDGGTPVAGGVRVGAGYYFIDDLSLDIDAESHLQLVPDFNMLNLGLTPGARYHVLPRAYVRVGAPIIFLPSFGAGILGGLGYHQPIGSNAALVVGVDYTWYFNETFRQQAPNGQVDLHAGVQTWF